MIKTGDFRVIRKIGTMVLVVALALSQWPAITLSAAEEPGWTVVKEIEGLSEDISNQKLPVGALESEIIFPETLNVKVVHVLEVKESEETLDKPEKDIEVPAKLLEAPEDLEEIIEGELGEEPTEVPEVPEEIIEESGETLEDAEELKEEPEKTLEEPEKVEEKVEDKLEENQETHEIDEEQTDEPETTDESLLTGFVDFIFPSITVKAAELEEKVGAEEQPVEQSSEITEEISVPVTWSLDASRSSADAFSSENPGDYFVYMLKLPEGYECEAALPTITVTIVGEEKYAFDDEFIIDGVKIRVTAAEGVFPEGATLFVEKVSGQQEQEVLEAVEETREDEEEVSSTYTFDIKVLDKDGNEIQPADSSKVKVSFTLEEISDSTLTTNIYHMKEADGLTAEKLDVVTEGSTATAETDGFSIYALQLTASEFYEYIDEHGKSQTIEKSKVTEVTEDLRAFIANTENDGWFVVNRNVTLVVGAFVGGNVKLILCDGKTLVARCGIPAVGPENSLTIYGQSEGTGTLEASGFENNAAIGGTEYFDGCNITICGGIIKAKGGNNAAGIGGGYGTSGTNIKIYGGTVEATGGTGAAGIGGGYKGIGTGITINGGKVTANGALGAGIGGGYEGTASDIIINGGTVEATSAYGGAGIGGGYEAVGSGITINGGTVNARSNDEGAGIGGGKYEAGSNIKINGGIVEATGGAYSAGIGGGNYGEGRYITITGGTVTAIGGPGGPGIGGGHGSAGYNITISGGKITAIGSELGAAIGGGYNGATIKTKINGNPEMYIAGGKKAQGIGSGYSDKGETYPDEVVLEKSGHIIEYPVGTSIDELSNTIPKEITCSYPLVVCCANGGTGPVHVQVSKDDRITLAANGFTKDECEFIGWNTEADGTGTAYENMAPIQSFGGQHLILFAQWRQALPAFSVNIEGWKYGEAAKSPSVSANPGNGEVVYEYKVKNSDDSTYKGIVPVDAGNYTVRAIVPETTYYYGGTCTADFEITKATPSVSVDSISKAYDGVEVTSSQIKGNATNQDIQVPGAFAFENDETFKDVLDSGDKKVIFTPDDMANYESVETSLTLTINPKDATVKADNKSKIEGDVEPELTATVTGLLGKDILDYILSRVTGETAGDYAISPSGSKLQGNYSVSFENGILTIKAAEKTEIITIDPIENNQQNSGGGSSQGYYSIPIDMPENMPSSVMRIVHPQENLANDVVRTVNRRIETPIIPEPEPETADAGLNPPTKIKEDKTPKSAMQVDSQETVVDGSSGNLGLIIALAGLAVIAALVSFWQIQCKRKIK